MTQRTSYKLVVSLDIVQELPDESTQMDVLNNLNEVKLTLERETVKALTEDYGYTGRVIITKLPEFN